MLYYPITLYIIQLHYILSNDNTYYILYNDNTKISLAQIYSKYKI